MTEYERTTAVYEDAVIDYRQKKSFIRWLRLQYWRHRYNTLTIDKAGKTVQGRHNKH